MKSLRLGLLFALVLVGASCNQTEEITFNNNASTAEPYAAEQKPEPPMQVPTPENLLNERTTTNSDSKEGPIVVFKTTLGDITVQLFEEATPKTVENFLNLANQGFYNDTVFHRVIPDFMIQGGDPNTREERDNRRIHGTGGPGYQFADEISLHKNVRGTISMANAGPNTNGSQFFINVADNNFLDGRHAVFGEVIDGLDIADKISKVQRDAADHPIDDIEIQSITVQE